ncbi:hypothetical protein GT50_16690 [Geobacillus stearothermophilus 10]|nr:hypothetical protein GT50_16690 [Geobacillus stearothermophilus 10]
MASCMLFTSFSLYLKRFSLAYNGVWGKEDARRLVKNDAFRFIVVLGRKRRPDGKRLLNLRKVCFGLIFHYITSSLEGR